MIQRVGSMNSQNLSEPNDRRVNVRTLYSPDAFATLRLICLRLHPWFIPAETGASYARPLSAPLCYSQVSGLPAQNRWSKSRCSRRSKRITAVCSKCSCCVGITGQAPLPLSCNGKAATSGPDRQTSVPWSLPFNMRSTTPRRSIMRERSGPWASRTLQLGQTARAPAQ